MTKSLMPGLVYATGVFMGTEQFSKANAANMMLIAFGVVICAIGELNLVFKGVAQQLAALLFEVCFALFSQLDASFGACCMTGVTMTFPGSLFSHCRSVVITSPFDRSLLCRLPD